jgi:hypothetical protein
VREQVGGQERVSFVDQVEAGLAERSVDRHSRQFQGLDVREQVLVLVSQGLGQGGHFISPFLGWMLLMHPQYLFGRIQSMTHIN